MAVYPNLERGLYGYTDDFGGAWTVTISAEIAAAGGFSPVTPGVNPPLAIYRRHAKLRGVYGKTTTGGGGRAFLPCPSVAAVQAIVTSGGFSINGTPYTVTGYRMERDVAAA